MTCSLVFLEQLGFGRQTTIRTQRDISSGCISAVPGSSRSGATPTGDSDWSSGGKAMRMPLKSKTESKLALCP